MKSKQYHYQSMSVWQLIFSQSKINGAPYRGEALPVYKWNWPTGTYLQQRRSGRESSMKLPTQHCVYPEDGETLTAQH